MKQDCTSVKLFIKKGTKKIPLNQESLAILKETNIYRVHTRKTNKVIFYILIQNFEI